MGYKLTDQDMRTYGGCQWKLGEEKIVSGEGELCGPGWLHYYSDPLLAVLLNPIHASFSRPRMFEARVGGQILDDGGLKSGCTQMTLLKRVPVPKVEPHQVIRFAMLCIREVYEDPDFVTWSDNWMNGSDRSTESAVATYFSIRKKVWAAEEKGLGWNIRYPMEAASLCAEAVGLTSRLSLTPMVRRSVASLVVKVAEVKSLDLAALARKAMSGEPWLRNVLDDAQRSFRARPAWSKKKLKNNLTRA